MTDARHETISPEALFESLGDGLAKAEGSRAQRAQVIRALNRLIPFARETAPQPLWRSLHALSGLLELADCAVAEGAERELGEIWRTIRLGADRLRAAVSNEGCELDALAAFADQVEQRWGECITLAVEDEVDLEDVTPEFPVDCLPVEAAEDDPDDLETVSPDQYEKILAAVEEATNTSHKLEAGADVEAPSSAQPISADAARSEMVHHSLKNNPELRKAFCEDAATCMASIEEAILTFESDPQNRQPLRQICRELHTLKGASASIGLAELAHLLHETEESLQTAARGKGAIDPDLLLHRMDEIRCQVATLGGGDDRGEGGGQTAPQDEMRPGPIALRPPENGATPEATLRVRTSQLDRLMDMLAELVMLRNRRQSGVERLRQIHGELRRIVMQLEQLSDATASDSEASRNPTECKQLREVTSDLAEMLRLLRELFDPLAADNHAVSGFIGQFRQELVALRRMPIAALFQSMRRVVRDAARLEGKQIRLVFEGEETGVEGALQERLYEPLLHMVRNAVGHGIELPDERTAAGKPPEGRVLLAARRVGHLLNLELSDDGRGLDYEALRRRGIERGLLPSGHGSTRRELAQLIFHPGFSTRDVANEVAGRGVGMDVVAATLQKMRSWIEVDSTPGEGTTIQLTIPLPSVIEHVMVFACGGQRYGLPMQSIRSAENRREAPGSSAAAPLHFADLLGMPASRRTPERLLIEAQTCGGTEGSNQVGGMLPIDVDEICGPEEVVVRPLPALLKGFSLFSGITLAGNGAIVLLLDPRALQQEMEQSRERDTTVGTAIPEGDSPQVLVVDDSRTARRSLVAALKRTGMGAIQAADGVQALQQLRENEVVAVFSDIEMPNLSGIELLAQIRASESWSQLPVFMVSSRDDEACRQETQRLGATAHLAKPVSGELIANLVDRLLREEVTATGQEATSAQSQAC